MNKQKKLKREKGIIEINSKEMKINLNKFQKEVINAYNTMKDLLPEAIEEAKIKSFGNASHIILPKKYEGKNATIMIKK